MARKPLPCNFIEVSPDPVIRSSRAGPSALLRSVISVQPALSEFKRSKPLLPSVDQAVHGEHFNRACRTRLSSGVRRSSSIPTSLRTRKSPAPAGHSPAFRVHRSFPYFVALRRDTGSRFWSCFVLIGSRLAVLRGRESHNC